MKIDYTVPCGTTIELAGDSEHRKKDIDNHAGDVGYLCFLIRCDSISACTYLSDLGFYESPN